MKVKFLKPLDRVQTDEVLSKLFRDRPDIVASLRTKLAAPIEPNDDEYLGREVMDYNEFCREAAFSFDASDYDTGSAFSDLVCFLSRPVN